MSLPDIYQKAETIHRQYEKIIDTSEKNKGFITISLKDNYRQSGRLTKANCSVSIEKETIDAVLILNVNGEDIDYDISEIIDCY